MPFALIVLFMFLCFAIALMILISAIDNAFDGTGLAGLFFFLISEIVLVTLIIFGAVWLTTASDNEELDWETFHNIVVDVRNGQDVKCVRVRHNSSIEFINMNSRFDYVIKEGSFVRRYANKHWNCNVYTIEPKIYYELIGPDHERYDEVKEKLNKDATTQPVN